MAEDTATTSGALKKALDELREAQRVQLQEIQPKIDEALATGGAVAELKEQMAKANADVSRAVALVQELSRRQDDMEAAGGKLPAAPKLQTPGGAFVEAAAVKAAAAAGSQETGKVAVPLTLTKDLSTTGTAGTLVDSLRLPGVVTPPEMETSILALIPKINTTSGRVDWVQETGYTNAAAAVAESTHASPVNKPQSNITLELKSQAMRTIAHWIPASRQILLYANREQLRRYVDGRLMYGLQKALNAQVLLGDGTGANLDGIIPNAASYSRGYAQIAGADPTPIDTIRRAVTQVNITGYPADGVVLHPADWESAVLSKGSDLHYVVALPGQTTTPRLWGMPVVQSTEIPEGTFLVGNFSLGSELYVAEEAHVEVSRSHASYFTQNLVAILAEMSALLALLRPDAFVTGSLSAGS